MDGVRGRVVEANGLSFTAYEVGEGPLVLCLHGFPDTPGTWRNLLPHLADAGYRAVAVTSRGYEPSSQPANGDYSLAALSADVVGWIDALDAERAHLIGHDWGSSIMHVAAARAPDRVASLAALAVPHPAGFAAVVASDFDQLMRSWYVFFFQLQAMSDVVVQQNDWAFLERLWRAWSPGWEPPPDHLAAVRETFSQPGVKAAALAYYRTAFDAGHPRAAETQALLAKPILAPTLGLTGERDGCIAPEVFEAGMPAARFEGGLLLERCPEAGHFLHLEQPGAIVRRLVAWITTSPSQPAP